MIEREQVTLLSKICDTGDTKTWNCHLLTIKKELKKSIEKLILYYLSVTYAVFRKVGIPIALL